MLNLSSPFVMSEEFVLGSGHQLHCVLYCALFLVDFFSHGTTLQPVNGPLTIIFFHEKRYNI